jgi:hypothetical protein
MRHHCNSWAQIPGEPRAATSAVAIIAAMPNLQRIHHNGQLAAIVIRGEAIIDDTLDPDTRRRVEAKCLYALEIDEQRRPGPYTDIGAERSAEQAARTTQHS